MVTAQRLLNATPWVLHIVPLTSTRAASRPRSTSRPTSTTAWCTRRQHLRAFAASRFGQPLGNIGTFTLAQNREVLGLILDVK